MRKSSLARRIRKLAPRRPLHSPTDTAHIHNTARIPPCIPRRALHQSSVSTRFSTLLPLCIRVPLMPPRQHRQKRHTHKKPGGHIRLKRLRPCTRLTLQEMRAYTLGGAHVGFADACERSGTISCDARVVDEELDTAGLAGTDFGS